MNDIIQSYKERLKREFDGLNLKFIHESDRELIIEYDGTFVFIDKAEYEFFDRFRAKLVLESENKLIKYMRCRLEYTHRFIRNNYPETNFLICNFSSGKVIDVNMTILTTIYFDKINNQQLQEYKEKRKRRIRKEKLKMLL